MNWADRFNICCFLDSHGYQDPENKFELLVAVGALRRLIAGSGTAFARLRDFSSQQNDWLFGHFAYDLKQEIHGIPSRGIDGVGFPDLHFFVPQYVLLIRDGRLEIGSVEEDHESVFRELSALSSQVPAHSGRTDVQARYTEAEYLDAVARIQDHIRRGDCYELNFCQEFFGLQPGLSPLGLFGSLSKASPTPFAAYYKTDNRYLICLSPERYLKKNGNTLISQPIKGTAPRLPEDPEKDRELRLELEISGKERAENIMVVDLVRNDLSRVCRKGTVRVRELCAVYTFPQVYQMISTVVGELEEGLHWTEAVRQSFPMGSMTGAPKRRVLEIIEQTERTRRGLFSGSLGYLTPEGDFDFNVVIRSLLYNATTGYLSFQAGSAITAGSQPGTEYRECLLKVAPIKKALTGVSA